MDMRANVVNRYAEVKRFATVTDFTLPSEGLQPPSMDTNDEVRRRRLAQLCELAGGMQLVAQAADTHWQYLDQVIKKRLLPARKDGSRVPASLGDDVARRIEAAYGLTSGWLDWPLDAVPFTAWAQLKEPDRLYVQGRMLGAIEERIGKVESESTFTTHEIERTTPSVGSEQRATPLDRAPEETTIYSSVLRRTAPKRTALEDAGRYAEDVDDASQNRRAPRKGGARRD